MKQERTKKKVNGLLVFSICLLIVALLTPLTFALFTDLKTSKTEITFGKIQIDAGKTRVDTNIANLLPSSAVFEDKVVVAKDVFSESYILRAKHSFASTNQSIQGIGEYLAILGGESFQKRDAQGNLIWEDNKWYSEADGAYTQLYVQAAATYKAATTANGAGYSTTFFSDANGTAYSGFIFHDKTNNKFTQGAGAGTPLTSDEEGNTPLTLTDLINGATEAYGMMGSPIQLGTTSVTWDTTNGNVYAGGAAGADLYMVDTPASYVEATTENVAEANIGSTTFYTTTDGTSYTEATSVTAERKPDMANGFILTTQAVDESGNVWASVYNAIDGTYTVTAVDANDDGNQDQIVAANSGYATDYQWYYHDGYFYLCEYFGTDTDTDDDDVDDVRIKEITKGSYANSVTLDTTYDLTTKTGRDGLVKYFDETLEVTTTGTTPVTDSLKDFKTAVDTAKTGYTDAMSAFKTAQTEFNTAYDTVVSEFQGTALTDPALTALQTYHATVIAYLNGTSATEPAAAATGDTEYDAAVTSAVNAKKARDQKYGALDTNLTAYRTAIANYSEARDLVAAEMKDYQQLYVFALGGEDYNTIPYDLYQLDNYAQYSAEFTLSLQFDAVQSENLRATGATEDLVLADTAIADLVGFFPTSNN